MKVSGFIAEFIRSHLRHVFAVSGGANLHLLDSLDQAGVSIICPQSEAAAGFAADAYARLHGLAVVIATSGPGATNLVTPIATSYYDSVPVLYITGQQTRARMKSAVRADVRQYGFQECPILEIVKPITKHAAQISGDGTEWGTLTRGVSIARSNRPGPVLFDIPDDVQRQLCSTVHVVP
jgi:acetolactate synthase I/II/III large subunit